jgi:predicted metal-dependent phosphoesterase TrpH
MAALSILDFNAKEPGFNHGRIDLHSHTNCSDGGLSPQALIDRALNFQIDVLAITDHDTVAGLDIAHGYIQSLKNQLAKKEFKLKLIDGIEISTGWQGFEIHIVGLNIDKCHDELVKLIASQQQARELRAELMGEKLTKCGFANIHQEAKNLAGEGSITRAHFAKVLLREGHVATMQKAFDKYIGKGQRAYVKPTWCDINAAVKAIHAAGGSAVMAHPIRYDLSAKWLRRLIVEFKSCGGDGLEIVLPQMSPQQRQLMLNYCLEYDLHGSMGSDFHHPSKWSDLGRNLTMPEAATPIWQQWL